MKSFSIPYTDEGVPISGYADGTFVQVDPSGDSFAKKVGADGEVARSMSNDNTHTVVITLLQSSLSNWNEGGKSRCVAFNQDFDAAMQLASPASCSTSTR
jgi:hypothetical protein